MLNELTVCNSYCPYGDSNCMWNDAKSLQLWND